MARRILFAESRDPEWVQAGRQPLAVDHWLEIQWKLKMFTDHWTGEIETAPATYEVTRVGGDPQSYIDVYGVLNRADVTLTSSLFFHPF